MSQPRTRRLRFWTHEKSIAVLPFENLSSDKENAYFADGIQDEILTRLSKIASLKVISRTSTQKYKSTPDNLREVGKQLGVAHLLEGSVQKIANAVHVNVQLIRAATDEHLWAESYNRKLDDVSPLKARWPMQSRNNSTRNSPERNRKRSPRSRRKTRRPTMRISADCRSNTLRTITTRINGRQALTLTRSGWIRISR